MGFPSMSGNYQQSQSGAEQSSGLMGADRGWFSNISPGRFRQFERFAREAGNDPGGLAYQSTVDKLLPMGKYGLPQGAEGGALQLGRDSFAGASGNRAQRGFNTPYNLEGVMGDAFRMMSGSLLPLTTQTALTRAGMAPQLRQTAFGYKTSPMQVLQNFVAGSSEGASRSAGYGGGASVGR